MESVDELRKAREAINASQADVAAVMDVSRAWVAALERGEYCCTPARAAAYRSALERIQQRRSDWLRECLEKSPVTP